jgi:hypothetical protein
VSRDLLQFDRPTKKRLLQLDAPAVYLILDAARIVSEALPKNTIDDCGLDLKPEVRAPF